MNNEDMGAIEQAVQTLTRFGEHIAHNRPGIILPMPESLTGYSWKPVRLKEEEDGSTGVYIMSKAGKRDILTRAGKLFEGTQVLGNANHVVGEYFNPQTNGGLYVPAVEWLYKRIADIWEKDNEFLAKWASFEHNRPNRGLKTVMAAFLLVQNRSGQPVKSDGEVEFYDYDYRSVGEAMSLIVGKGQAGLPPVALTQIGDILQLPGVAKINHDLGFGRSAKNPFMGRYAAMVRRFLRYRESNPRMLDGLVNSSQRNTVINLAKRIRYKPATKYFYKALRWPQKANAHREIMIGAEVDKAVGFEGLTEAQICQRIVDEKIGWHRLVGMLPSGLTRAIVAACVEAGGVSDKNLIILTPTLESLGLTKQEPVASAWKAALAKADDRRAENIARNVRNVETAEALEEAADKSTAKAVKEAVRDFRIYVMVDKSMSMTAALKDGINVVSKIMTGLPPDQTHVCVFNTVGRLIEFQGTSRAAIEHGFSAHRAAGGTIYSSAVGEFIKRGLLPKENEDVLFIWIGDEEGESGAELAQFIRRNPIQPLAFGFRRMPGYNGNGSTVRTAAQDLGIPCFTMDAEIFDSDDPYVVNNALRDLIAATPVGVSEVAAANRKTLMEQIIETDVLERPKWAA